MSNRIQAFREWDQGIITDENLEQVIKDLQEVIDILYAMGEGGLIIFRLHNKLESAERLYETQAAGRRTKPKN